MGYANGTRSGFGTTIRGEYRVSPTVGITGAVTSLGWLVGSKARVEGHQWYLPGSMSYSAEFKTLGFYGGVSYYLVPRERPKEGSALQIGLAIGSEAIKLDQAAGRYYPTIARSSEYQTMGLLGHCNWEWRFGYAFAVGLTFEYRYILTEHLSDETFQLGRYMDYSFNPPREVDVTVNIPSHDVSFGNWNLGFLFGIYF